jgi:hypothetical protein
MLWVPEILATYFRNPHARCIRAAPRRDPMFRVRAPRRAAGHNLARQVHRDQSAREAPGVLQMIRCAIHCTISSDEHVLQDAAGPENRHLVGRDDDRPKFQFAIYLRLAVRWPSGRRRRFAKRRPASRPSSNFLANQTLSSTSAIERLGRSWLKPGALAGSQGQSWGQGIGRVVGAPTPYNHHIRCEFDEVPHA